jgi:hypothetical protein
MCSVVLFLFLILAASALSFMLQDKKLETTTPILLTVNIYSKKGFVKDERLTLPYLWFFFSFM